LEFEAMRDAMLAVAGQLDLTMGGKPVKMAEQPFPKRRAVYGFIDRQDLPGLYRVFDLASPDQSCPRRASTTVPQQALFFMNSPFVIQCATELVATPPIVEAKNTRQRVEACYQAVFARLPSDEEVRIGGDFIDGAAEEVSDPQAIWRQYAQLLMMSNAFLFVD
jgi:hypothetical protein